MTEDGVSVTQPLVRRYPILLLLLFLCLVGTSSVSPQTPTEDISGAGTLADLHSDRRVVQSGRWLLVREYTVDFAVRDSQQTWCGEIITIDATEAHDLIESRGQAVQIAERGKDIYVTLKDGRKIRAHRLNPEKCPRG